MQCLCGLFGQLECCIWLFPKFVLIILLVCSLMTSLEAVTMMMNKNRNCMCPLKWQLCLMVRNTMKVMQCTLSIGDCVRKKCTAHAHLDCLHPSTNRIINYFVALKLSWLGDVLWSKWMFRLRRKLTLGPLALHQNSVYFSAFDKGRANTRNVIFIILLRFELYQLDW